MDERKRVHELLAAYGTDAERWPAGERHLARRIGEAERTEAARIDAWLGAARAPDVPAGALERLEARLPGGNVVNLAARRAPAPLPSMWAGAALAASLAIGIYLGGSGLADDLVFSLAQRDEPLDLMGLGDVEAIAEEDQA